MKVIFTFGGLPHYLVALLNKLQDFDNLDIIVVIPDKKSKTLGHGVELTDQGNRFRIIRSEEYLTYYGKPSLRNLPSIIKDEKPDIFITLWPYVLSLIFNPKLKRTLRRCGSKIVLREIPFQTPAYDDFISYYRHQPVYDENLESIKPGGIKFFIWAVLNAFLRKRYYRIVDAVLHYTEENQYIPESYGVSSDRIFVTYNSPDTERLMKIREELNSDPGFTGYSPYKIIHVGRLVAWKRVDLLLQAVATLVNDYPQTELLIIGRGPEKENLERLSEKLNITENVIFAGDVYEPEKLGKHLMSASVYVLAGMGGLSINEAMCFGKPVICSRCDGTEKTLVENGVNGYFFREGDAIDLVEKISLMFKEPGRSNEMGMESLRIIKTKVNLEVVAQRFLDAFGQIAGK